MFGYAFGQIALAENVQVFGSRNVTLTTTTGDVLIGVNGTIALVRAGSGDVLIRSGNDVHNWPTGMILAANLISIYGDWLNTSTNGTIITLQGAVAAPLILVFGNTHDDTVWLDHVFLGGRTRVHGSNVATPASTMLAPNVFAPEGDGNDSFFVLELPSMSNIAVGHTVTIDGQSGSNTTSIWTAGSQGALNNYVINVLGTGAPDTGVQTLNVYGVDNGLNGINPATQLPYATNDIFLLRSATSIPFESAARPQLYQGTGDNTGNLVSTDPYSAGPAFVALLHATLAQRRAEPATASSPTGSFAVERINYDTAINGRLNVYGLGGNDYFAVDDNSAITTLDGGAGDDTLPDRPDLRPARARRTPAQGNLLGRRTTLRLRHRRDDARLAEPPARAGRSSPRAARQRHVHRLLQPGRLRLEGERRQRPVRRPRASRSPRPTAPDGDSILTAGLRRGIDGADLLADAAADQRLLDRRRAPRSAPAPATTRSCTTSTRPVSIDGGNGFDKVVVLGTEFADHIVVTDKAIFGAGVAVTLRNVEVLEVDGLEGDDTFDVLSTAARRRHPRHRRPRQRHDQRRRRRQRRRLLAGHPGHERGHQSGHHLDGPGLRRCRRAGRQSERRPGRAGRRRIQEAANGTTVAETLSGGPIGTMASYTVRLAQAPIAGQKVYVTVSAQQVMGQQLDNLDGQGFGDSILIAAGASPNAGTGPSNSDFYDHHYVNGVLTPVKRRSLVLVFDAGNWSVAQTVTVGAVNDVRLNRERVYAVSHSVVSGDPFFNNATVTNVNVTKRDADRIAILTTQLAQDGVTQDTKTVVLAGDATTRVVDRYELRLDKVPTANVTVGIAVADHTVVLSSSDPRFVMDSAPFGTTPGVYHVNFTPGDAQTPVLITVSAANLASAFEAHDVKLTHTVAAGSAAEYANPITGAQPSKVYARVVDNKTPGVFIDQPQRIIATKCGITAGNTDCTIPGPGGSYTARLTMAPAAGTTVTMQLVTDGQTDITTGGRISLQAVGVAGRGLYTGSVIYDATAGTLRRADGSSWLDDGFLEGQLFKLGVASPLFKIQALSGSSPDKVDILHVTTKTSLSTVFPGTGTTSMTLTKWAAVVTFDTTNWWIPVTVPIVADPYYAVTPGSLSIISFPKAPHLLTGIRGPLEIIGGPRAGDNSFQPAVMLPLEQNGPLFGIRVQPPEAKQIDTLNIFNDGSQADTSGVMTRLRPQRLRHGRRPVLPAHRLRRAQHVPGRHHVVEDGRAAQRPVLAADRSVDRRRPERVPRPGQRSPHRRGHAGAGSGRQPRRLAGPGLRPRRPDDDPRRRRGQASGHRPVRHDVELDHAPRRPELGRPAVHGR